MWALAEREAAVSPQAAVGTGGLCFPGVTWDVSTPPVGCTHMGVSEAARG